MKKILAVILCLVFALSLAACSSKNAAGEAEIQLYNNSDDALADFDGKYTANTSASATGGKDQGTEEKIIKTVNLNVQTKEYTAYLDGINASVTALGGYVESSETDLGNTASYNRNAIYTLRIPAEKLDEFLTKAGENGKITNITEEQKNVTLDYVDLESRISALNSERETLTKLLEKAESLENVLAIQERLLEVIYEYESYTAQLRVLENRVSYSTVTMHIYEVERVIEEKPTLWSQIKNRFSDNLGNLRNFIEDSIVDIIGGLPVIIPAGVLIFAAVLIIKKIIRKRRAKKSI